MCQGPSSPSSLFPIASSLLLSSSVVAQCLHDAMSISLRALPRLCCHDPTKTATILLTAHLNSGKSCTDPLLYDIRRHPQKSQHRCASSSSSTRWKTRQAGDHFAKEAKIHGLKSRAAFKLLQINDKYKLFRRGDTVVDLGYAPGSWSQVAINRTQPNGRVIGVDILPAQPPRGVSTIQGDFLSPEIQAEVRSYVLDHDRGRAKRKSMFSTDDEPQPSDDDVTTPSPEAETLSQPGYLESERQADLDLSKQKEPGQDGDVAEALSKLDLDHMSKKERDEAAGRVVDVVLSDMCEPWEQTSGFHKRSISDPYRRMMNTSGNPFRDHAGSMVCNYQVVERHVVDLISRIFVLPL